MAVMIRTEGIEVSYGEVLILKGISIEVNKGEAVAVIGSNGAGKTTLLKSIAGLLKPKKGKIFYQNLEANKLPIYKIVRLGMVYIPAERELFPQMTVLENLELGAYTFGIAKAKKETLKFIFDLFPRLEERKKQMAGTLSGGEQQMLAIGRGLMSRPKALLLDEPSTGLAPLLVAEMYLQFQRLKKEGSTILLAEQQIPAALSLANTAYVLENGIIRFQGKAIDFLEDPEVKRVYLGVT